MVSMFVVPAPPSALDEKRSIALAEIVSAIIRHEPLPAIMQKIADTFATLHPGRGIAVFLKAGTQFRLEAEAGLPPRQRMERPRQLTNPGNEPAPTPALREILTAGLDLDADTGIDLCIAAPLLSSTQELRGVIGVFADGGKPLEEAEQAAVRSLCELGRLALEHSLLWNEVVHRSQYDPLTGLPNRLLLEDRLLQAMTAAKRQGSLVGVCCLDLDRFKQINDTLGHDLGDQSFKKLSERLQDGVREIDTLARHGGDEFLLALRDLTEVSDIESVCIRLLKELSAPLQIGDHSLTITGSMGISIYPLHGDTPDLLLRNADLAMQAAKRDGRGLVKVYSPGLGRQTRRAAELVEELVTAVAKQHFRIAYQPIFTPDRTIMGFEALLRWKHPKWGQISPREFIPLAEQSGLIVPMGDWVIEEVCRQAIAWQNAGIPPAKMFANISGVQLQLPDFASKIAQTLERTGLAPDLLELEITESWIISDLPGAACKLQKLRDLGIGIAIDDFGAGYSTFNYLQELPLDTLKVDRSFVQRLDGSPANLATVRAIRNLAQQLGLKTVAEGVESEQHLQQLTALGFELMQGFFLSRPLKPQAACFLLKKQRRSSALLEVAARRPHLNTANAEVCH